MTAFEAAYGAKFPKAVAKITDDLDELLAFYDFPAEHWIHLRTTNPIESTFATVRHRTKVTKARAHAPPGWPWRSSSSRPPRTAGARSTPHTSSRSSAPAPPSSTASSSNDPTTHLNQKPPKRSSSTGLDYCSCSFRDGFTVHCQPGPDVPFVPNEPAFFVRT